MVAVLSSDGILRNFTGEDFKQYGPGTSQTAAVLSTIAPTTVVHPAPDTTITLTGTEATEMKRYDLMRNCSTPGHPRSRWSTLTHRRPGPRRSR